MKAGIIGLPNVGKSTLFNCLSNTKAQSANFPFCTIEPNLGIINVPDVRLNVLEKLANPLKTTPATVEIVDIAGLVKGASKGEGLGNQFLANIREADAIIHVIRCFDDDEIIHIDNSIDPLRDKETIELELQLKDFESVEKKLSKIQITSNSGNKNAQKESAVLNKILEDLKSSKNVRNISLTEEDRINYVKPLQLLSDKPILYVCNVPEKDVVSGNSYVKEIVKAVSSEKSEVVSLGVKIEADINALETYEERQLFITDLGLTEPGSSKLIKSVYKLLSLHTFFTLGEKEVRAWTIPLNSNAQDAAGVIHSDFAKGFIKAEVFSFQDYEKYKSDVKIKEAGKMKIEGKDYIVKDGDIIYFRFNI